MKKNILNNPYGLICRIECWYKHKERDDINLLDRDGLYDYI